MDDLHTKLFTAHILDTSKIECGHKNEWYF